MSVWLKVNRPNIEIGANFVMFQTALVNLEEADGFAVQQAGSISFFIDGKAYVVQQQHDPNAYQAVLAYAKKQADQPLI